MKHLCNIETKERLQLIFNLKRGFPEDCNTILTLNRNLLNRSFRELCAFSFYESVVLLLETQERQKKSRLLLPKVF